MLSDVLSVLLKYLRYIVYTYNRTLDSVVSFGAGTQPIILFHNPHILVTFSFLLHIR